jgi:hypothetical protein
MRERVSSRTYPGRVSGNLGSLTILSTRKELLVLLDVQITCARKVRTAREFESELSIIQGSENIRDDSLFIDANT